MDKAARRDRPRAAKSPRWSRPGLTLIELLVVLVLLGLALAVAAPSFLRPARAAGEPMQRIIAAAREAAIRRAESLTLAVSSDGRWIVEGSGDRDSLRILSGTLDAAHASAIRLHISPLGACMLDSAQTSERRVTIDPLRCRMRAR